MQLGELIRGLSRPEAYPDQVEQVEVIQTHISAVFLAGEYVYKVKKPVDFGFLDFSTLDKRRHFCEEEVRINRRLAREVYLGVVPIALRDGAPCIEADGEPIEYAVKMKRLDPAHTLQERARAGSLDASTLQRVARRLAEFHRRATRNERVREVATFDTIADNVRANLTLTEPFIGRTLTRDLWTRLNDLTETAIARCRPLITARCERGVPCETHGDLHLDHVYVVPGAAAPDDLVMVDGIEFNERFRFIDPVADVAFLGMDLCFHGCPDLAEAFRRAYFAASGDIEGEALWDFYCAYRALVRGKVESLELNEDEIPEAEKARATKQALAHFLLALRFLAPPAERPAVILCGGLPGTGKSVLARRLAEASGGARIATDVVRKELIGIPESAKAEQKFYSRAWSDRTYDECLRRAGEAIAAGRRVILDATFVGDARRTVYLDAARRWCVPFLFFVCRARAEIVKPRIAARTGDASDADVAVYEQLAKGWEPPSPPVAAHTFDLDAEAAPEDVYLQAKALLKKEGLG